jgi:HPt (histidine-containing phosphotransfer) domain-containing protein
MSALEESPLFSTFTTDPDMAELVEEFIGALPERVRSIEEAVQAQDLEGLRRLAHQLRGAGGGYGFDVIGQAAASLEASAQVAGSISELNSKVQELIALCQRAKARPD